MKNTAQLEQDLLSLPPAERARLVLAVWESLESDTAFAADRSLDSEGVQLAMDRDREIETGLVKPLTQDEFRQRTSGTEK